MIVNLLRRLRNLTRANLRLVVMSPRYMGCIQLLDELASSNLTTPYLFKSRH